ncbi:MAG: methyltransferase domain-containing protein [Bdellovibrionaceae bacterium]|nr:methyltransferase domain-containing protein [Pseudobdellovibrionaceae bacterium]
MSEYKSELKKILLLKDLDNIEAPLNSVLKLSNEKDLASFFIDSIYIKNVILQIIDDHWIQSKNSSTEVLFDRFIKSFLNSELKPMLYLHSFFANSSIEGMHQASKALTKIEFFLLSHIKIMSYEFQKKFLQFALTQMSDLYELEHQLNSTPKKNERSAKLSLYRSFDILDQIFELEYIQNEVSTLDQKERLYEGAGIGVQSSYATILLALKYLNLGKKSQFIDLGSGYGRIGLVVGLMRPDIHFTGFEYVKERVEIATKACTHLKLDQHVHFVTQDLSNHSFKIPDADTYYIFDSFSDASFATVMEQLQEITYRKKITVVTKGNAKLWMNKQFWTEPQEFSDGNLCLFRSRARPKI